MLIVKYNIVTFVLVITSLLMVEGLGHIDFSNGNLLYLPLGASIFAYLLYGFGVLPGVALANTLVGYLLWDNWFGGGMSSFIAHVVVGSLAPIAAMMIMKLFHLSNFFDGKELNFRHIIFLVLLTAIINTLLKFFIFMSVLPESPNPSEFISTYLVGDILGGLVFIYLVSKMSFLLIKR